MATAKKLSVKTYLRAIVNVAVLSLKTAPVAVLFKLIGIVIYAGLPILVTYFAAQTISELTAAYGGDTEAGARALWLVGITAGVGLLSTAWRSVDQYIQQLMRYKVEAKVGDMMYEQFLSLDFWQYDDKNTVDLYDRAQKFTQFYAYVFDRISALLTQFITLVFAVIALVFVFPWLAFFTLIAVIPGVFIQFKLSRAQIAHWNKNVDVRRTKSYIEYNLLQPNAIAELKLNGLIRHFMDLRATLRTKDERYRLNFERQYISWRLIADAMEAITELGALIWVVLQIIAREQPLGQFLYVQQMVSRALTSANSFVAELSNIDEDLANLFDYQAFMNLPIRSGGTIKLTGSPQTIAFNNVTFRYRQSSRKVLQGITLTFGQGQHVAIVGENGAGKSTLVKLLAGLYKPTSGTITVDGTDLQKLELGSWHRRLSLLQQDFQQYGFATIQDNVYFGDVSRPFSNERYKESLQQAEATSFIQALPQKSKTYPNTWMEDAEGNKGVNLSGGQWQRVALARNFYRNAPIIVLDEPTSAIDALAEARVFDRLFGRGNEKTVITVSHRLSTVEKADVIVVLDDGRVVETGTHKELVAKKGYYYRLFERQLTDK